MRNMSFSETTAQIRDSSKTVTRRLGWTFIRPGDVVMACVKCQGLKKGQKVEKIRPLLITQASRERLDEITFDEVRKEGFRGHACGYFINMFCRTNKCRPNTIVTRIEFIYIMDEF